MPTSGSYFTGYFGQVVLLNTALSAAAVAAVFSQTSPQYIPSPPSPPPPSPSPPPSPPAPPPPLTYAQFPGCTAAVNGLACRALADFYVATQLSTGAWTAALSAAPAPGANAGGWAFSTANYCAWSGVGCAVATTGLACVSDTIPNCVLKSLCVVTACMRSWLEAGLTRRLLPTQVSLELEPRGHHPCIIRHYLVAHIAVRRGTRLPKSRSGLNRLPLACSLLNNNLLSGAIPPELGSLSSLSVLCAPRTGLPCSNNARLQRLFSLWLFSLKKPGGEQLHRELTEQPGIVDRPAGAVRSLLLLHSLAPLED